MTTSHQHNAFGEPIANTATIGSNDAVQMNYTRDKLGRITSKTEVVNGHTIEDNYEYDLAGRLVSATRNGVTTTWAYDANGNRTHENGQPVASHDEQDRLTSYRGAVYEYTANGELKSKTESGVTTSYNYDELGNLMQVRFEPPLPPGEGWGEGIEQIDYLIDGRNRRIGKKVNGTLTQGFLYQDQLNPIAELDGSGNVVSRFIYADKINVPAYMIRDGRTYRIVSDHLGSPRLVVDSQSGEIAQRIEYDVWGNITEDSNPGFQPFGFAGGIYDLHTGLVRFGARDYDPVTARWTSKDPIRFAGGDANLYGYVINDLVNLIDPSGKIPPAILAAGLVLAAYGAYSMVMNFLTGVENFGDWLSEQKEVNDQFGALPPISEDPGAWCNLYTKHRGDVLEGAALGAQLGLSTPGISPTGPVPFLYSDFVTNGVVSGATSESVTALGK